ncbi:MAG: hypothetical protein AB9888_09280 [Bacteroidales bacterium]
MEQRDFILREIEKMGAIIGAIRQKLFGGTDELSISRENRAEVLNEMLLGEAFIDLDEFLAMDAAMTDEYLAGREGFNVANIEMLAQTLSDIGMTGEPPASFALLEKALQLYEICSLRDRTYSFEREAAISQLRDALQR